jgi:hypothetical protein
VSVTIVQTGTGIAGTPTQFASAGDWNAVQDATAGVGGGQMSLTLRTRKGKPGARNTSSLGTLSAELTRIPLRGVTNGVTILPGR